MLAALLVVTCLVSAVTLVHYEALWRLDQGLWHLAIPPRTKLLVAVAVALAAHALEAAMYAVGLWLLAFHLGEGSIGPLPTHDFADFLYFSVETYTSLGLGDLTAHGPLRIIAGLEALHGLLMIGWSASFLHLAMERFWGRHRPSHR